MGNSLPEITIVIPTKTGDTSVTLESLAKSTFQGFKTIIVPDEGKGANWARNEGFKQVDTEFVLFSDDDIEWKSEALETLLRVLKATPKASFSYGRYKKGTQIWCHEPWDPFLLKHGNYISTMSLIRTKDFPGFDNSIKRLQDWDLFLTMMEQGKRGVYVEDLIFETQEKPGITHGGPDYLDSILIVKQKHNL